MENLIDFGLTRIVENKVREWIEWRLLSMQFSELRLRAIELRRGELPEGFH